MKITFIVNDTNTKNTFEDTDDLLLDWVHDCDNFLCILSARVCVLAVFTIIDCLCLETHKSFLWVFLGLFTTAIYKKKTKSAVDTEPIANITKSEFNILLTAKNVFMKNVSHKTVRSIPIPAIVKPNTT